MKFLIKIEEAINNLLEQLLEKLKAVTPEFVFTIISFITHLPAIIKSQIQKSTPKVRIFFLKLIGYTEHYTTMVRGYFITLLMYLRSEEFKKADKTTLILMPFRYAKANPVKAFIAVCSFAFLCVTANIIFSNAEKIAVGTYALRKPASNSMPEEDLFIEFKNHKFEIKHGAGGGGGGHGAPAAAEAHGLEIFLDIKVEAKSVQLKDLLEKNEKLLEEALEAHELSVSALPLSLENQVKIEEDMTKSLDHELQKHGHKHVIKSVKIKQVLKSRPTYYRQSERMISITEINFQIFLEDTHRNRQVWMDFTVLASNRNIILYLKDHDIQLKDHLTTNVEPILPQLPIEEEGRLIIKDKMRDEINQFLQKNNIEGKVLDIYIDYLIAS